VKQREFRQFDSKNNFFDSAEFSKNRRMQLQSVEKCDILRAIPHKERLATLHAICLQISRHISQKCS